MLESDDQSRAFDTFRALRGEADAVERDQLFRNMAQLFSFVSDRCDDTQVSQYDEVRAQTVVDKTPMDKVAVSRAVASLVEKGLIEKRTSETDRRSAFLHLSAEGDAIARQILAVALAHNEDVLAVLDADERKTLHHLLDKLIGQASDLSRK